MNLHRPPPARSIHGFSLIECLAYISVLGVLISIGGFTVAKAWDQSRALARNASDIEHAINTGERWRKDIRSASRQITTTSTAARKTIQIPTAKGLIEYEFTADTLRRRTTTQAWTTVLAGVKSSEMQQDTRSGVAVWSWEMELEPVKRKSQVRPIFSFVAVPARESAR